MIVLTVYSRPQCHLCDEMIDELLPLIDGKARLEIVDISGDPELVDKYDIRIPVLACGDIELATYELDRDKLAGFLERS